MISIIIPTLNQECSLPSLLEAIRQQAAEHEVICSGRGQPRQNLRCSGPANSDSLRSHGKVNGRLCRVGRQGRRLPGRDHDRIRTNGRQDAYSIGASGIR